MFATVAELDPLPDTRLALAATWTDVDRMRQYRGLIDHCTAACCTAGRVRRGIPTFGPVKHYDGRCRWCGRPTKAGTVWHKPCVVAYWLATANQAALREALGAPHACPCGQPGTELDHTDALSVASASGDLRRYRRALTIANLRWLCHRCHADKTADDRLRLRRLLAGEVPTTGPVIRVNGTVFVQEVLFGGVAAT